MPKTEFKPLTYSENQLDEGLIRAKLGRAVKEIRYDAAQPVLVVDRSNLRDAVQILRDDPALKYDMFVDITAADLSRQHDFEPERRFQVIVILYSDAHRKRIRLKVYIPEQDCTCPSLYPLFRGASFTEREAYEMFGIRFEGHPNLIRLLTPEYMKHFPLRKEYPMNGLGERDNFPRYEEIQ